MYIRGWFKPIFPVFLTRLLSKLKLIIPMVCRSQGPRGLRRRCAAAHLLSLWVRIAENPRKEQTVVRMGHGVGRGTPTPLD